MANYKPPLSPIPEVDEEAIAIQDAKDIEADREFTVTMGGEELLATTIYIHNVNKAIKKRIEQYNTEIEKGDLRPEVANTKLERFIAALHRGLLLFESTYAESIELTSGNIDYSKYVRLPDLPELTEPFASFLDKYVKVTRDQLKKYINQSIDLDVKESKAESLQKEILELANAMLRRTSGRVLSVSDGIIGGKKTKQRSRAKRTRRK